MKSWILLVSLLVIGQSILDRTYYDALQIPVSASSEEIKDSFRKLSRKYHPDRNPGSKDKFELINVAYEALINPDKKFLYDRVGRQKFNDPNVYNQFNLNIMKGPQLNIRLMIELKDFYLGKQLSSMVEKVVACPHCHGSGAQNPYDIVTCKECQGKGRTTKRVDLGGGYYNLFTQTCPRCAGRGKVIGRKCHLCKQQKIIPGIQQFIIKIKPGTASGQKLTYMNMGDQKLHGAPSDIIFELIQIPHQYMKRDGNDLRTEIHISLEQAILGFKKTIKHLDDREIQLSSNQITQPGSTMIVEGQGMPVLNSSDKGNLYVKINVIIPRFSDQEKETLKTFFEARNN